MNRRELFSFMTQALTHSKEQVQSVIRPPYYQDLALFDKECINCEGMCAKVCPTDIIHISKDKMPFIDFTNNGCTYCDDCATVCVSNVLQIEHKKFMDCSVVINKATCMSWNGVMCFSCKDPCLEDAIDFQMMFMPTINQDLCTSCGFCIQRCPSYAIDITLASEN